MRCLLAVAMVICSLSANQMPGGDNPFKAAKVGDWVEYKVTGPKMEGKTKMTIVALNDKEVTYERKAKVSFGGGKQMDSPPEKFKIDLTRPYDAISAANLQEKDTKIEKVAEGVEKLQAGGTAYDTKWTQLRTTTTMDQFTVVTEHKMWFSKDVPLSGLVRQDTTSAAQTTKLELIASGRGK